jgi:signal transduction histidine kinase
MLIELQSQTNAALEDLRDLARGIYPPLLADKGLAAALEAQTRKASLSIKVRAPGIGRYPPEIEAATYFSCLEALQNVAKYAEVSRAVVTLSDGDGTLRFEVADEGAGFDPARVGYGTGLRGISDRLGVLAGTLSIASAPGQGTRVIGTIPIGRDETATVPPGRP